MPRFLVTYHGSEMPHDAEAMAQARAAFMQWAEKTGSALVDQGAPIAGTKTISTAGVNEGAAEGPFQGWSVVEAPDEDAAAGILSDHPFVGRGGVLQINTPVEF